jgi:hypothetical protein
MNGQMKTQQNRLAFAPFVLAVALLVLLASGASAQIGPLLRIEPNPASFDTTLCGTTKCRDILFRNVGDAPLAILGITGLNAPFSANFSSGFTLAPGAVRTFSACYSPVLAPALDSQAVTITANGRVPLSIAMVFDTSGSMSITDFMDMSSGTKISRIAAANRAGRQFVSRLVDTLGINDEAGIFRYSSGAAPDYGFRTALGFTTNRTLLENAIPSKAGGGTCTFQALRQTLDQIRTRNLPGRRVIVLLSDGDDGGCGGLTIGSLISHALTPDPVRIYTIGIGNGITPTGQNSLKNIADGTGGRFFRATDVQGLLAVYDSIATMLSQNPQQYTYMVSGRAVAPFMVLDPAAVDFDSVHVGVSRCLPVRISNTGDAPLVIGQVTGVTAPFSIQNLPATPILPGTSATVDICFNPSRLRVQTATARFAHNSCRQPDQTVALRGVGYDSVTISLTESFDAKPGSTIYVPIRLNGRIPADYNVDELEISISYNKTMLYPLDQPLQSGNSLAAPLPLISSETAFGAANAVTTYSLRGGTLVNPGTDSLLVRLGFLVLHGNALTTPISIVSARLADGNPRVGIVTPGMLRADSLCYQQDRLIDASARYGGSIAKIVSSPSNPVRQIDYRIEQPARVMLALYDNLGRQVMGLVDDWRADGDYTATLDASGLPNGIYYLRLEAAGFSDTKPLAITK